MIQDFLIPIYIALGFFILLIIFLVFQVLKLKKRLDIFLSKDNKGLEGVLKDLIAKSEINKKDIYEIFNRIARLEDISKISIQKVGVIRYNPFKDVGGDQSFSIALLDSQDSGFIITSLYMREETKIFAKPVIKGTSKYLFSDEEKKAIEQAKARNF